MRGASFAGRVTASAHGTDWASRISFIALFAAGLVVLAADMWNWAWLAVLLLWTSLAALLRPRWAIALFATGLLVNWAFSRANAYKIALSSMPITALDLKISATDSETLWNVLGLPQWSRWALILAAFCAALALAFVVLRRAQLRSVVRIAIFGALFFCVLASFEHKLTRDLRSHLAASERSQSQSHDALEIWSPKRVAAVSRKIGPVPFLVYSWTLEQASGSLLFDSASDASGVSNGEVAEAAQALFSPIGGRRPNIVLVQLESMFNPNWAFHLSNKVDNFLFEPNELSHYLLPMRVNIVGGGSWVTEFEVLTGLDYRLFGYSGYYAHATVSPYIDGGFPAYLKQKGYRTIAFYTDGEFYNARAAYGHYGFDTFWDFRQLPLNDHWHVRDTEMADAFVRRSHEFEAGPFFAFLDTNGGHSPYRCSHFDAARAPADNIRWSGRLSHELRTQRVPAVATGFRNCHRSRACTTTRYRKDHRPALRVDDLRRPSTALIYAHQERYRGL